MLFSRPNYRSRTSLTGREFGLLHVGLTLMTRFIWAPSIDGDIIPDSPHSLLQRGEFARIPFISGNNKDE